MTTIIHICGAYSLLFALFHSGFWKMFGWGKDLANLSNIELVDADRRIMHILNIQTIWYFVAVAFVCFAFPVDLLGTRLGHIVMGCCSIFWLIRAVVQPIFLGGKLLVSFAMTLIFLIGAVLFALPVFNGLL
jgi:hypothetical protein